MKITSNPVSKQRAQQILENAYNADSSASFQGDNIVFGNVITAKSMKIEDSTYQVEISSNYFVESTLLEIIEK